MGAPSSPEVPGREATTEGAKRAQHQGQQGASQGNVEGGRKCLLLLLLWQGPCCRMEAMSGLLAPSRTRLKHWVCTQSHGVQHPETGVCTQSLGVQHPEPWVCTQSHGVQDAEPWVSEPRALRFSNQNLGFSTKSPGVQQPQAMGLSTQSHGVQDAEPWGSEPRALGFAPRALGFAPKVLGLSTQSLGVQHPEPWGSAPRASAFAPKALGFSNPEPWGLAPRAWGFHPEPWGFHPKPWGSAPRAWVSAVAQGAKPVPSERSRGGGVAKAEQREQGGFWGGSRRAGPGVPVPAVPAPRGAGGWGR